MESRISGLVRTKKTASGDYIADVVVDLCFVTSYKIEDLLMMPASRLKRLIERYIYHYCKEAPKQHGK
ncbi:MAG: hypothetical protein ACTSU7_00260 [Candidatus Heimdallarchaeaceae archaeon]